MRSIPHFLLTLFILLSAHLYCQEFGEISEEELQMTSVEEDPDADVVILFDKANIIITKRFGLEIEHHTRIKILTEAGKSWADINIPYIDPEEIEDIEAHSVLPNGQIFELDDDNIFEENIKSIRMTKFAIPGVEVGSVIEYKYSLFSEGLFSLKPWYFQSTEFTRLSEVSVLIPTGFRYAIIINNGTNINLTKSNKKVYDIRSLSNNVIKYSWTGRDIMPLKEEPFMTAFEDYFALALFQLVSYQNSYIKLSFKRPWEEISKFYSPLLDTLSSGTGKQDSLTVRFDSTESKPLDKAKKIFNFVRSEIETEENNLWIPVQTP